MKTTASTKKPTGKLPPVTNANRKKAVSPLKIKKPAKGKTVIPMKKKSAGRKK